MLRDSVNRRNDLILLCQKFATLFQKLKDLKEQRKNLENENKQLIQEIEKQRKQEFQTQDLCQHQIMQLQQQVEQLDSGLQEKQNNKERIESNLRELEDSVDELESAQRQILAYIQQQTVQLRQGKRRLILLNSEYSGLLKENYDINQNKEILKDNLSDMEQNVNDTRVKLREVDQTISEAENQLLISMQEKEKIDLEMSTLQADFQQTLHKNAEMRKKISEKEKVVDQISEELESQIQRLVSLINHNQQLINQLGQLEICQHNFEILKETNEKLQSEEKILQGMSSAQGIDLNESGKQLKLNMSRSNVTTFSETQGDSGSKFYNGHHNSGNFNDQNQENFELLEQEIRDLATKGREQKEILEKLYQINEESDQIIMQNDQNIQKLKRLLVEKVGWNNNSDKENQDNGLAGQNF